MAKVTKKGKTYKVDFGGVEGTPGQRRQRRIPEGDYLAKILKGEPHKSDAGKRSFRWQFQILESASGSKKYAGVRFFYYTSLQPDALFNLRNLIFAASDGKKNVTGKSVNFNPKSLEGKKIGVIVEDEEYKKKMQSKVVDVQPPSMIEAEEEDEDEDEDEDEEEDEDEDDDEDDEDEDEDDDEDEEDEDEEDDLDDVDLEEDM